MHVSFVSDRLERDFLSEKALKRAFGDRAKRIMMRLDLLEAAKCLADVPATPPSRRHELKGDRAGCFAVDVTGNWRLVFRPNHDPVPLTADGGFDLQAITAITIVAVTDYH